ncbi:unnamed protein product [Lupinus luteus]|uniref:Amino acid transporter transmembrane domain-containing protein n=1 Tax=Lupinus luteus TaxID=3873 RepID=A0AAV1VTU4_LUPLU
MSLPDSSFSVDNSTKYDDDGRIKRTGTWVTASAHIVTAVIGSGVLSLAWAVAQLGWIAGPIILVIFSVITLYTSCLLSDCYRSPDPITGTRNRKYITMVKNILGGVQYKLCGWAQYGSLIGVTIGYSITAAISMVAIKRSNCFHKNGHQAKCHSANYPFMVIFGVIQILLSQIPDFHELSWLSILAAIMSFGYATIGVGLSIAKIAEGEHVTTSLTGTHVGVDVTSNQKIWNVFQSIGNIAFAYAFSVVLVEIQVFAQPIFDLVETTCAKRWPEKEFITKEYIVNLPMIGPFRINLFRSTWRTFYVIFTTILAILLPFFNSIVGLLGAISFWPLTVYFPTEMHLVQAKVPKFSMTWIGLKSLTMFCLIVTLLAIAGSIEGIVTELKTYEPFS